MSRTLGSVRWIQLFSAFTTAGLVSWASAAWAQLPTASLSAISPPGAKVGGEVAVKISGSDLDDVTKLQFSHPGITATQVTVGPDDLHKTATPQPGEFNVKIAGNVPAGLYEARAVGRFGVTNPRFFHVSDLEEKSRDSNNTSLENAMVVPVGSIVNGEVGNDTVHYYKVAATPGQRVLFDCLAQRIDSRMDATLKLFDPNGNELQLVRDTNGLDPVLELNASEAGEYTVAIYDFTYVGGATHFYRLAIHTGPYIDFIYPPAGMPGQKSKFTLYGRNLPGGKPVSGMDIEGGTLQQLEVEIALPSLDAARRQPQLRTLVQPYEGSVETFPWQLTSPQGTSNVVNIAFATAPVIAEQEPNDNTEQTQSVNVPCEFVGQFYPRGDLDWVQFEAKMGDVYWVDLVSHRQGNETDPSILIEQLKMNDQGEMNVSQVASMDDTQPPTNNNVAAAFTLSDRDPRMRFEAKADATYRVAIRDLYSGSRTDPRQVYRLVIRRETPDFNVIAYVPAAGGDAKNKNAYAPRGLTLRRGEAARVKVRVNRQDGFDGEVSITAQGLPAGVTSGEVLLGSTAKTAELALIASGDASAFSGNVQIVAKGQINGQEVTRIARPGALIWGTKNAQQEMPVSRMTLDFSLAVLDSESMPASITAGDGKTIDTCLGAKFDLPIKVARFGDFKGPLKVKAEGLPREIAVKEVNVTGADGKAEITLANNRIKAGTYSFTMSGPVKYKYTRNPDAVKVAQARQKELEQIVQELTDKAKQAADKAKQAQDAANKNKEDKSLAEAAKAASEAAKAADDIKKKADDLKKKADAEVKTATDRAKPKDITINVASAAVNLRVAADPLQVTATAPGNKKQGEKFEIPVKIERKYGFDDAVTVSFEPPSGVTGVSASKLTIAKGQSEGKLAVTLNANAKAGNHQFTLRSRVKFNNLQLDDIQKLALNIEAVEAPK